MDVIYGIHAVEEALKSRGRAFEYVAVARDRKDAKLQKALRDSSVKLEAGPTEDHYWDEYAKTHPFAEQ